MLRFPKIESIVCVKNDFYAKLYNVFAPSAKLTGLRLLDFNCETHGHLGSIKFVSVMLFKIQNIIQNLSQATGNFIIYSDIDLIFPNPNLILPDLNRIIKNNPNVDLFISPEHRQQFTHGNSGFMLIKKTQSNIEFFNNVLLMCRTMQYKNFPLADQSIINSMLHTISFKILPYRYWNETVGLPYPETIMSAHANYVHEHYNLKGTLVNNKLHLLNTYKKFVKYLPFE